MKKILIYGMGNVGRNLLFYLSNDNNLEIGIVDRNINRCKAIILDFLPLNKNINIATDCSLSEYDLLFVTAGIMDEKNRPIYVLNSKKLIDDIFYDVITRGFKGNVIIISNPTDVLSTYAYLNYHNNFKNILSTGTIIDSLRLETIINKYVKLYGLHGRDCVSYYDYDISESDLNYALDFGYEIQRLGFNSSYSICLAAKILMDCLDGNYVGSFVASKYNMRYNASFSHDLVVKDGVVHSLDIDENNPMFFKLSEFIGKVKKEVNE